MCVYSVRSSTLESSSSPYSSWRRWALQRARCLNTACTWGISLCESWVSHQTRYPLMSTTIKRIRGLFFVFPFTSRKSKGLSGRALRKLPFLAHALFVKVNIYFCTKEWWKTRLIVLQNVACLPTDNESDACTVSGGYGPSRRCTKGREI